MLHLLRKLAPTQGKLGNEESTKSRPLIKALGRARPWLETFWSYFRHVVGWIIGFLAIVWALWWMFSPTLKFGFIPTSLNLRLVYNYDMENSLWMMSYQGHAWQETGNFALTFNNIQVCGMPYPLFYGWGFYPYAGLLTILCGARMALRIILFGALAMQYASIIRLGRKLGLAWEHRHVVAIAVTWAIYPLTNLYTRGDVPEFVAMAFMISSLCCFLAFLKRTPEDPCVYDRWAWGFYYLMTFSTHAITGYYGGLVLVLCALAVFFMRPFPWKIVGEGLLVAAVWLVIAAPWLFVIHLFMYRIPVGSFAALSTVFSWSFFQVHWYQLVPLRLYPFALELWHKLPMGQFDTQISDPLLLEAILLGVLLFLKKAPRKGTLSAPTIYLAALGLVIALLTFVGACVPEWLNFTKIIFAHVQFPYRLVNYVDLGLLIIIMALAATMRTVNRSYVWWLRGAAAVVLLFAFGGLTTKLKNGAMTGGDEGDLWTLAHPYDIAGPVSCFYGRGDYSVVDGLGVLDPKALNLPVVHLLFCCRAGGPLNEIQPQMVSLQQPTLITTQIEAFPWNDLLVDGRKLEPPDLGINRDADPDNPAYACVLPPGNHILSYEFNPSPWLSVLRTASFSMGLVWGLAVLWFALMEVPLVRKWRK